jgi:hypothetical protein
LVGATPVEQKGQERTKQGHENAVRRRGFRARKLGMACSGFKSAQGTIAALEPIDETMHLPL